MPFLETCDLIRQSEARFLAILQPADLSLHGNHVFPHGVDGDAGVIVFKKRLSAGDIAKAGNHGGG